MEKILKHWAEFIDEWKNKESHSFEDGFIKPQFYDFMEWLVKKELKNLK